MHVLHLISVLPLLMLKNATSNIKQPSVCKTSKQDIYVNNFVFYYSSFQGRPGHFCERNKQQLV